MNFVLISDLHLTDEPYDEYRWGVFPFLREKLRTLPLGLKELYILGDLTDRKDRHSAKLVNRVVENIVSLYRETKIMGITILRGNHDGLDGVAYFEFLKHFNFIKVITNPQIIVDGRKRIALLPHTRTPEHDWKNIDLSSAHYIFAHVTVQGATERGGYILDGTEQLKGLSLARITGESRIYSGDVHVPHRVGAVEYVGAPYPVRFGDAFRGRIVVINTTPGPKEQRVTEWHYPTIQKAKRVVTLHDGRLNLFGLGLRKNDQLKVEVNLGKEERHLWHKVKEEVSEWCAERGVVLRGLELRQPGGKLRLRMSPQSAQQLSPTKALKKYVARAKPGPRKEKAGIKLFNKATST